MNFFAFIKSALNRISGRTAETLVSPEMQSGSELWHDMYINNAAWLKRDDRDIFSLHLASAITNEFSRLVFAESVIRIDDENKYAEAQNRLLEKFLEKLDDNFGTALALGGMMFKPYLSDGVIDIDMIRADSFVPVAFSGDMITSAVFVSRKQVRNVYYTLTELHEFNAESQTHTIKSKAFYSMNKEYIGMECGFDEVPEWNGISPEIVVNNVSQPLFSYFRVPFSNDTDISSPLGVSVYSKAVELIRQADEQWARIEWEYESKETALDVGEDMLRNSSLPKRKKRVFRQYDTDSLNGNFYNVFSPDIRESSMFAYFNRILQRIEFNCGLAYGVLSDPQTVEKTAEEIRSSKQRSYTHVSAIQKSLEASLNNLMYAVDVYSQLSGVAKNDYTLTCVWGDSVLEDTEKEFQRRLQMVTTGLLTKEKFIMWYFNCDEKDVAGYIPQTENLFGGA